MSNIVEPQITETKPLSTWFSEYIKNNPNPPRLELLGQSLIQPSVMPNKGEPYVFLKDFSFIYSTSDGSDGSNMVNYKKDQVVFPFAKGLANEKRILEPAFKEALDKGVLVPQKMAQQKLLQQQLQQGIEQLTLEDKFYEKLGIKYHNTHMFGVASRMKGRFYLGLLLIAGYFAYKKFKK